MRTVVFLGAETAYVVAVMLDRTRLLGVKRRFVRALPVGRMVIQLMGKIDYVAVGTGISHGSPALGEQKKRQRQTQAYRKCLPRIHDGK